MSSYHITAVAEALRRVGQGPFRAAILQRVTNHAAAIATELRESVLADVPQFLESRNPDLLPELARHGPRHIEEILRLLRGEPLGSLEFVREHARRRAEQRFPLEATLHAYRSGHKVLARWLRGSAQSAASRPAGNQRELTAIADFAMEYTDAISTIFATTYASHTRLLADVAGDRRAALLQVLLEGYDESDARVARSLRDAGFLDARQSFCVALARSVDPVEMLNAERARRLADAIDQSLAQTTVRRLIDVRANKVTVVLADVRRVSGWTAPRSSLAERLGAALAFVGNAALIGISNDAPSTSHIPAAHQEAATALELADVSQRVVPFAEIPLQRLLLYYAGKDFQRVLPGWVHALHRADQPLRGALTATLRAYARADMNVLRAAEALRLHPNTLYARFQRIHEITGCEPRSFEGLTALLIGSSSEVGDQVEATAPGTSARRGIGVRRTRVAAEKSLRPKGQRTL